MIKIVLLNYRLFMSVISPGTLKSCFVKSWLTLSVYHRLSTLRNADILHLSFTFGDCIAPQAQIVFFFFFSPLGFNVRNSSEWIWKNCSVVFLNLPSLLSPPPVGGMHKWTACFLLWNLIYCRLCTHPRPSKSANPLPETFIFFLRFYFKWRCFRALLFLSPRWPRCSKTP